MCVGVCEVLLDVESRRVNDRFPVRGIFHVCVFNMCCPKTARKQNHKRLHVEVLELNWSSYLRNVLKVIGDTD